MLHVAVSTFLNHYRPNKLLPILRWEQISRRTGGFSRICSLRLFFGCSLEDIRVGREFSHWPRSDALKDLAPFVLEEQCFFSAVFLPSKIQQISSKIWQDGRQRKCHLETWGALFPLSWPCLQAIHKLVLFGTIPNKQGGAVSYDTMKTE